GGDDHAGVDIGRTYTESPRAATPSEFLAQVTCGNVLARGDEGSPAKWAHAAIALAARSLGGGSEAATVRPDPRRVLTMVLRLLSEGDARQGPEGGGGVSPQDARCL